MHAASTLRHYFPAVIEEQMFVRQRNLAVYQKWLFEGIDFQGARVLDIGAGSGLFGFYAACNGAAEVVCLEPEVEGSTSGVRQKFTRVKARLGLENIRLEPTLFQDYDTSGEKFDVILLHNSVNHLDEPACERLLDDERARQSYRANFRRLAAMSKRGTTLVLADCSRRNLFAALGIRNPFMPTIEWEKHQSPELWARMLTEAGFRSPRIRWSSFNALGRPGQLLLGHAWPAYLLKSHFCLTMRKA